MRRTQAETVVPDHIWPVEFAADEIRAALVLTRTAAEGLCSLAEDVARRLPTVQQAFGAGIIDQPRVRVFSLWTLGLADPHTEAIVAALLPKAHLLTTAQLIHQIQRHAIALDPDWARRRYEQALRGRRVVGRRNEDGTANLSGYDLPTDQVAAACDRLDRLAKAAKQAGHPDPIDHLRADLFLGMTDGTFAGLTDPQILHRLLTQADLTQPPPDQPTTNQPGGDQPGGDRPGGGETADASAADDKPGHKQPGDESPVTANPVTASPVPTTGAATTISVATMISLLAKRLVTTRLVTTSLVTRSLVTTSPVTTGVAMARRLAVRCRARRPGCGCWPDCPLWSAPINAPAS